MTMTVDFERIARYQRVEAIRRKHLEPLAYCLKWVPRFYKKQPEERGFKAACIRELMRVTELDKKTIEGWGADFSKRPKHVLVMMRQADIINQVRDLVGLPPNFPQE